MGINRKLLILIMVIFTGAAFLATGALTAAEAPDCVTIDNKGYERNIKGPVTLSHKKHAKEYGAKCTDCHHDYQDGKNVWKEGDPVKKCAECHSPTQKQGNALKLNNAYHQNCLGCHKEMAQAGKIPRKEAMKLIRKCDTCHAEKK